MNQEIIKRILSSILIIAIAFFFITKGSFFFIFFLSICFFITSFEWYKMTKNKNYFLLGLVFLILSFLSAFLLRNIFLKDFILVILICISTDIGGFVFGKIFKGSKLTKISPNKTYSGMIGSFFLSIIFALFYTNYYGLIYWTDNLLLITVILISSVSQIGDLTVSYFKRISKIKNTGKIIPGHGGLLDRIDGMIFAIPFAFIFFKMIKFI
jgi:phosphatidate cytidylyltransferase